MSKGHCHPQDDFHLTAPLGVIGINQPDLHATQACQLQRVGASHSSPTPRQPHAPGGSEGPAVLYERLPWRCPFIKKLESQPDLELLEWAATLLQTHNP